MSHDLVVLRTAPRQSEIDELAFVLDAVGIPHRVYRQDGVAVLAVPASHLRRANEELAEYLTEQPAPLDHAPERPLRTSGWAGGLVYAALILGVHALEQSGRLGESLFGPGSARASLIRGGEWWRTITALTLHVDIGHVAGNAAIGGVFGALLCRGVGNGVGWLIFLLSGALGNALNVAFQDAYHNAVGASTGVFGVLGALGGWQFAVDTGERLRWTRRFAPVVGSVLLLTFLGGGEEGGDIDVMAHVTGFVCGGLLTYAYVRWLEPARPSRGLQGGALALVVGLLNLAWWLALR